ncbi:hypothetical protein ES703_120679 [subsurface metagenome]
MENKVDMRLQNQWEAKPDEDLKIPEAYIRELKFEVVVFSSKRDFTFRCKDFKAKSKTWLFEGVLIDTSKRNPQGEVYLKRLTYHPAISLVNVGFMIIPAPEGFEFSDKVDDV